MWERQVLALSEAGFRVVVFDRRGHGRSDVPAWGYDLDTLADDVAQVLEERDMAGVMLVGHQWGEQRSFAMLRATAPTGSGGWRLSHQ
jgi:pimeloyl-ACP methyl ester carboxylesterase